MKVGILTFHFVYNYGGVLQAYALQYFLKTLGFECSIIDYRPKCITGKYKILDDYYLSVLCQRKLDLIIKLSIYKVIGLPSKIKQKKKFNNFIKKYLILAGDRLENKEECSKIVQDFDTIVCGSDQIWNSKITNGLDPVYFAYFDDPKLKRFSYAASIGNSELEKSEIEEFEKMLRGMDGVSVREKAAQNILKNVKSDIKVVCDPVFLLPVSVWDKISKPVCANFMSKRYVLLYVLEENRDLKDLAQKLSKDNDLYLYEICLDFKIKRVGSKNFTHVAPEEFLALIKNAEFVLTNSFHASAFSIIFHKCFFVKHHSIRGERTRNILQRYGLEQCDIDYAEHCQHDIDWHRVDMLIDEDRKYARNFLSLIGGI